MLAALTSGCESEEPAESAERAPAESAEPAEPAESAQPADDAQPRSSTTLRLADEPTLSIGVAGGDEEQELFEVSGAARLADGSIVVYESGAFRLQRFTPDGDQLWHRGQPGEGPGDFSYFAELLVPCASEESILIHDPYNRRIAAYDGDGTLLDTYPLTFQGSTPYDITCAPGGRLVFSGWGHESPSEPGPYRTTADMAFADVVHADMVHADSGRITVLREGILAEDRLATAEESGEVSGTQPGIWPRSLRFSTSVPTGCW